MDQIREGWFSETNNLWPGQSMSLRVKRILYHKKSSFQDIVVFESTDHGNVLVLDGVIQCTERDEFSYQEMITHLPINSHADPKEVLIIGGGDGGVARELCKHPNVHNITMCEIDECVIEASKNFLPTMSCAFENPKLKVVVSDGFDFVDNHPGMYDVIITDSSDPFGPATRLFEQSYYKMLKRALKPGGIVCAQGECMWLHLDLMKDMQTFCKELFPVVEYAYTTIPTYPSGQIGFLLCSVNPDITFKEPVREFTDEQISELGLKYYNSDIHRSSFVLPQFVKRALRDGVMPAKEPTITHTSTYIKGINHAIISNDAGENTLDNDDDTNNIDSNDVKDNDIAVNDVITKDTGLNDSRVKDVAKSNDNMVTESECKHNVDNVQ